MAVNTLAQDALLWAFSIIRFNMLKRCLTLPQQLGGLSKSSDILYEFFADQVFIFCDQFYIFVMFFSWIFLLACHIIEAAWGLDLLLGTIDFSKSFIRLNLEELVLDDTWTLHVMTAATWHLACYVVFLPPLFMEIGCYILCCEVHQENMWFSHWFVLDGYLLGMHAYGFLVFNRYPLSP
ncbi:hypothetical protein ACJX0J_005525, partial [Zea mays]